MSKFSNKMLAAMMGLSSLKRLAVFAAPMDPPGHQETGSFVPPSGHLLQQTNRGPAWSPFSHPHSDLDTSDLWHPAGLDNPYVHSSTQGNAARDWQRGNPPTWSNGLHYSDGSSSSTQPWTLPRDQYHDISSHSSTFWAREPAQPSPPIDEVDRSILDSVLLDIEREEHARAQAQDSEVHAPADGSDADAPPMAGAEHDPFEMDYAAIMPLDARARARLFKIRRQKMEPEVLRSIPYSPPLKDTYQGIRARIYKSEKSRVRRLINSQVFGGSLRWVDLKEAPDIWETIPRLSPTIARSRRLPLINISTPEGSKLGPIGVYVTDHGNGKYSARTRGTVLEKKPYFAFWGMPDQPMKEVSPAATFEHPMEFLGLAFLSSLEKS